MEVFGFILAIILVTGLVLSCISSVRDMISELRYRPTDAWDIVDIVVRTLFYNTSKSSFLDNDPLPEYRAEQPYTGTFSGKRIYRGLYRASDGTVINADVNGAYNIMRKGKQNFRKEGLSSGLWRVQYG